MTKKHKFPLPTDCKLGQPAVLCPASRVLKLHNQFHPKKAKKIAKGVRAWFIAEAIQRGWAGSRFLPEVQSNYGAGCILWIPSPQIDIDVHIEAHHLLLNPEQE